MTKPKKADKKINYEEAIKTVKRNINGIKIDSVIKIVLTNIGSYLKIDGGMYKKLYETRKDEIDKIHDIHDLLKLLIKEWTNQIFKDEDEKARKIFIKQIAKEQTDRELSNIKISKEKIEQIAKALIARELSNIKTSEAIIEQIANNISETNTDDYLRRQIDNYMLSDYFLTFPTRVNLKIWKSVVDAIIFNVPIEKILECKQSILEKDYLPTAHIENGFLYISINELTSQTDMLLAWDRIKEKQDEYKNKYGYLRAERGCKNPNEDRIILDFNNQGLKPKKISKRLHDEFEIELRAVEVSNRLKEIRKRARVSKGKEILSRFSE